MKSQVILCGNTWELLLDTNTFSFVVSPGILGRIILLFGGNFAKNLKSIYLYFDSLLFTFFWCVFILHIIMFSKDILIYLFVLTIFPFSLILYLPIILPSSLSFFPFHPLRHFYIINTYMIYLFI